MKLSQLLLQREAMLRQARLANLAFAYWWLDQLVTRINAAGLHGEVCLQAVDPTMDCGCPMLIALEGSQSVIEEHFTDANIVELADLIASIEGGNDASMTFRLEDMATKFLRPLEHKLTQAGIVVERETLRVNAPEGNDPGA